MIACFWRVMPMSNFWYTYHLTKSLNCIPWSLKDLKRKVSTLLQLIVMYNYGSSNLLSSKFFITCLTYPIWPLRYGNSIFNFYYLIIVIPGYPLPSPSRAPVLFSCPTATFWHGEGVMDYGEREFLCVREKDNLEFGVFSWLSTRNFCSEPFS